MNYSVFLRPFIMEDVEKINAWRNDERLFALTVGRYRKVSLEIEKNWLIEKMTHNQSEEYFAICLNDSSQQIIGYFSIKDIDIYNRKANFAGIVIEPAFQDGVYMIDTYLQALDYAFRILGLNRIKGGCLKNHIVSRITLEMLGFKLEGIEKMSVYTNHDYQDLYNYAILYQDYKEMLNNGDYKLSALAKKAIKIKKKFK